MKIRLPIFLVFAILGAASCATKQKTGVLAVYKSSPEDLRLTEFFRRSKTTDLLGDKISIESTLQLPEIEIPRHEKLQKKHNLQSSTIDNAIDVYNHHVCVQMQIISGNKVDYPESSWSANLRVDGKNVETLAKISDLILVDVSTDVPKKFPGWKNLRVCSLEKFPKVTSVEIALTHSSHGALASFTWSKPWPN